MRFKTLFLFLILGTTLSAQVELGIDRFFSEKMDKILEGKRVGIITNHTGVTKDGVLSAKRFKENEGAYKLAAIFTPEHGLRGNAYAGEGVEGERLWNTPVFSLHGKTRRPTQEMLKNVDVLIYDIQDIGVRSYTYASTLFLCIEEAAIAGIPVIVLDRPNPMGGNIVDGSMLDDNVRSFIGYVNVSYCHGMTIGELATLFNHEYNIGCKLKVVPMKGWSRAMSFEETGLMWIPTSPHIPEASTPLFNATTGILGELGIVSIGIGYTLPFKCVAAPFINAESFAKGCNSYKVPGVHFQPIHYRPFYGAFAKQECHGVLICVTNRRLFKPSKVQALLMGELKNRYPKQVMMALQSVTPERKAMFAKAVGNQRMFEVLKTDKSPIIPLVKMQAAGNESFRKTRAKYLCPHYANN